MAETDSPCRFKSWIKTISPSLTTCAFPSFFEAAGGTLRPSPSSGGMPPDDGAPALKTGEFSNGTSGEYYSGINNHNEINGSSWRGWT